MEKLRPRRVSKESGPAREHGPDQGGDSRCCPYLGTLGPELDPEQFGAASVAAFSSLGAISYKPLVDTHL